MWVDISNNGITKSNLPLFFEAIFETITDGLIIIDADTKLPVLFNQSASELLGYEVEEFSKLKLYNYETKTKEEIDEQIKYILDNTSAQYETIHKKKNGELLDINANVICATINNKQYIAYHYFNSTNSKKQSAFLHNLINAIPDPIWAKDLDGKYIFCNYQFEVMIGHNKKEIIGKTIYDIFPKIQADFFTNQDEITIKKDGIYANEEYLELTQGNKKGYFDAQKSPIKNTRGENLGVIGIAKDITERMQYIKALEKRESALKQAQEIGQFGSWHFDLESETMTLSNECYKIFDIPLGTIVSYELFLDKVYYEDKEIVENFWCKTFEGKPNDIEHRIDVNGEIKWIKESAKLVHDENNHLVGCIGIAQDISERKKYQLRLENLALYDQLTGVLNRAGFLYELNSYIDEISKSQNNNMFALLIIDLDRLKDVNDSFGHIFGDELLALAANRLKHLAAHSSIIGRIGGDEFCVAVKNIKDEETLLAYAEMISEKLSENYKLSNGTMVHIGSSCGVAFYPDHGVSAEDLVKNADAAVYVAKNEGGSVIKAYTDDLTKLAIKRVTVETSLRDAIQQKHIKVFYQPQVYLPSNKIIGAEALVRWITPTGMISPLDFINIAEESGLIVELGEYVLNEACKQTKEWHDKGHKLGIAVNVSTVQLRFPNFKSIVSKALKQSGLNPKKLELEITESALAKREDEVITILHSLKALGVKLALDDFGTGYSSLTYLKRLPIDVMKIDKSFMDEVPFSSEDVAISKAIIGMAKALNLSVIAEGIEREDQIDFLREHNCDIYQGYIMSKPVDAVEFEEKFLK